MLTNTDSYSRDLVFNQDNPAYPYQTVLPAHDKPASGHLKLRFSDLVKEEDFIVKSGDVCTSNSANLQTLNCTLSEDNAYEDFRIASKVSLASPCGLIPSADRPLNRQVEPDEKGLLDDTAPENIEGDMPENLMDFFQSYPIDQSLADLTSAMTKKQIPHNPGEQLFGFSTGQSREFLDGIALPPKASIYDEVGHHLRQITLYMFSSPEYSVGQAPVRTPLPTIAQQVQQLGDQHSQELHMLNSRYSMELVLLHFSLKVESNTTEKHLRNTELLIMQERHRQEKQALRSRQEEERNALPTVSVDLLQTTEQELVFLDILGAEEGVSDQMMPVEGLPQETSGMVFNQMAIRWFFAINDYYYEQNKWTLRNILQTLLVHFLMGITTPIDLDFSLPGMLDPIDQTLLILGLVAKDNSRMLAITMRRSNVLTLWCLKKIAELYPERKLSKYQKFYLADILKIEKNLNNHTLRMSRHNGTKKNTLEPDHPIFKYYKFLDRAYELQQNKLILEHPEVMRNTEDACSDPGNVRELPNVDELLNIIEAINNAFYSRADIDIKANNLHENNSSHDEFSEWAIQTVLTVSASLTLLQIERLLKITGVDLGYLSARFSKNRNKSRTEISRQAEARSADSLDQQVEGPSQPPGYSVENVAIFEEIYMRGGARDAAIIEEMIRRTGESMRRVVTWWSKRLEIPRKENKEKGSKRKRKTSSRLGS